jgi:hypothetical protein
MKIFIQFFFVIIFMLLSVAMLFVSSPDYRQIYFLAIVFDLLSVGILYFTRVPGGNCSRARKGLIIILLGMLGLFLLAFLREYFA